jgi:AcrR family transcriptional regulator
MTMVFEGSAALRHAPKQNRGLRKVDHILRSAEALFAEIGFENATTNAIATRAGVSIGSLYQFFASKEAILEAMATRYLQQTRVALDEALKYDRDTDLHELLPQLIQLVIRLQEQRPYFLQCMSQFRPSPALTPAVMELNDYLASRVAEMLKVTTNETDPKMAELRAHIICASISGLMPIALKAKGRARTTAINEISQIVLRYIEPTLLKKG